MAIQVVLVVAAAENGIIGRDGDMPWRLSSDLKHFRRLTLGKPVIMGRKTYQAIGRPLPGRETIVVTRDAGFAADGVHVAHGIEAAMAQAVTLADKMGAVQIAVAGGAEIYALAVPYASRVEKTEVHATPDGDTRFPPLGPGWRETGRSFQEAGPRDTADMSFVTLLRDGAPLTALPITR